MGFGLAGSVGWLERLEVVGRLGGFAVGLQRDGNGERKNLVLLWIWRGRCGGSEGVGGGKGPLVSVLGLARSPHGSESVAD